MSAANYPNIAGEVAGKVDPAVERVLRVMNDNINSLQQQLSGLQLSNSTLIQQVNTLTALLAAKG